MAIINATVTIIGKSPILFNSFSVDSIPLKKRELTGVAGNDPEEWKRTVLKTKDNQLYVGASYIFGCLRDGAKHVKRGRGSIQAAMASTLIVLDEVILLDRFLPDEDKLTEDKTELVYLDVRSVKNPSTKGRNVRYRVAASSGWRATFKIEWENTIVSKDQMEQALINAGAFSGLGDGRTIGHGRFLIEKFELKESMIENKKSKSRIKKLP